MDSMIRDFGVKPGNITVLSTESDFKQMVKHVHVTYSEEEMLNGFWYYEETEDAAQREAWITRPFKHNDYENTVPENLLPAIKFSFMCYSQGVRQEML